MIPDRGYWRGLVGTVVACLLIAPAGAKADSGSITNVHAVGGGGLEATYTTTSTECNADGFCGWFPFAVEVRPDEACDPASTDVIYVGTSRDAPGTEVESDTFFPEALPTKMCLFISRVEGDRLVAEVIYTPPFAFGVRARSTQRLKPPGRSRFNNLVMNLRCSLRCSVRLSATPRYRAGGRRRVVRGLQLRETFGLPANERSRYGFHFTSTERRRLNALMARYGPILWRFRLEAEARDGQVKRVGGSIRMLPERRPQRPQQRTNCQGYSPCLPPGPDVDCAGGSGNGPRYVRGPVTVRGSDPYGLDDDGNGVGCES